jgi:hypothetical protein
MSWRLKEFLLGQSNSTSYFFPVNLKFFKFENMFKFEYVQIWNLLKFKLLKFEICSNFKIFRNPRTVKNSKSIQIQKLFKFKIRCEFEICLIQKLFKFKYVQIRNCLNSNMFKTWNLFLRLFKFWIFKIYWNENKKKLRRKNETEN